MSVISLQCSCSVSGPCRVVVVGGSVEGGRAEQGDGEEAQTVVTVAVECVDEVKEAVEVVARVVAVCYKIEEAEPVETLPVGVGVDGNISGVYSAVEAVSRGEVLLRGVGLEVRGGSEGM